MSETNGTGIIAKETGILYPTLELGGTIYTVKFTRGALLYRLSKSGVAFTAQQGPTSIAYVIDVLHAVLFGQFEGSPEDLSDIVIAEDKMLEASQAITEAVKKVFPPTPTPAAGTVGETEPAAQQLQ